MRMLRKSTLKYFFAGTVTVFIFCTLTWKTARGYVPSQKIYSVLTTAPDTIKPVTKDDSLRNRDKIPEDSISTNSLVDTIPPKNRVDTFEYKLSKDSLDAPVHYEAEDSVVVLINEKKIVLYGKTKTEYKDIVLTAPKTELDQQSQLLTAFGRKDSLGDIVERAHFKDKGSAFESDTIRYNFKTQRGITTNTFTHEGDFFIFSSKSKKVDSVTTYAKNGVFTTCNLDDPHFGFHYNKIKVINNKLAVSGPIYPEFEGVPIKFIALPFGIFPLNKHRHSGFLPPQFTTNERYGLGLEGIGYYQVLNQYFDVTVRSNIYSYGGWSVSLTPTYRRRYKYNGAFNITMQTTKENFKGDPDYVKNTAYFINWNHSVDSKARPGTSFTANVSAGSTKFNRYVPNSPQRNFQNQMQSSITYSKIGDLRWLGSWWNDKPYSLTLSANHNQNDLLHLVNMSLPDVGFTINTLYPFQKTELVGSPKWYEKIGIGYNGVFRNQFSFYDTAFSFKRLIDTLQWGAQHNLPISLSLPPMLGGALILSPSINYQQLWIAQKMRRTWNAAKVKTDTTVTKGIFLDQTASISLGMSSAVYGFYDFKGGRSIRHVMRPSISFSYKPDLSKQHFYSVQTDTGSAARFQRFSEYEGSLFGYFNEGKYGGASFALDNNLEMKKSKGIDSTTGKELFKKTKLIDGFGFSTSYNFMIDSFQLAPFNFYARTTLFEKIQITGNAILNPYDYDEQGFPVNKLFKRDGKFYAGRLTNGNISVSTDFKSKPKDAAKEETRKKQMNEILTNPSLMDRQNLTDYMRQNPGDFVDFNIAWTFGLGLSVYFTEQLKRDLKGFDRKFSASMNFNGSFNLSPKWNFSMNGYYDINTKKLQSLQMSISRDLHCWQMTIGVVPVGLYRSFSINISPKSSILQDLKINRSRYFSNF
jgi:LPS-assembly protein